MIGCIIDDYENEKLWEKLGANNSAITPKELWALLSVILTETEADMFNDGEMMRVQKIRDILEVYDQTGVILTEFDF